MPPACEGREDGAAAGAAVADDDEAPQLKMHSRNNALFLLPGRDGVQIQPSAGQAELRRQHSDRRSATPEDTEVEDAERANVQRLQSELPDSLKRRQGAREWAKGMNKAQSKPQAKPLEVFLPSVVSRAAPVVVAAVRVLEDEEATNNKGSAKDKAPLSAYSSVSKQQQINKIYALTKTSAVAKGSTASFLRRRLPQRQAALPPSNDIALQLDPIPQLAKTESGLRQQEDMLARRLDAQIVQYGEDIPLSFLRSRHHGAFAQRMAVHHLVRLLERQHMRAVATAFLSWHKTTITRRILATHARQVFLARQTALAHAGRST
ncbi:TPA: hypothetical protein N0F65_002708 [Lagenidium giganteum]|uniref:Uncharacterized protein n=1 Tax=Lagenidium giganteum TaxID=4803 RepID=A0AAV2Z3W4_9STRA|nr:TPA: hypothetical protein N0F65_002708 [Lagenidium giganteum]